MASHCSPMGSNQQAWVWGLEALLRMTQQSSNGCSLIVATSVSQTRSWVLGPKITVCWLSQWPAPESRPSQLQTCQQKLGMLPMGTDRPSQVIGTVPAEPGTKHSWRPAEPAHTYPIVPGTNGETVSALRGSTLPRGAFPGTVQDKDISSGTSGPSHGGEGNLGI